MIDFLDGGPAFPTKVADNTDGFTMVGMSMRDYFAAKVVQGLAADPELSMTFGKMAKWAYELADAMLEARTGSVEL